MSKTGIDPGNATGAKKPIAPARKSRRVILVIVAINEMHFDAAAVLVDRSYLTTIYYWIHLHLQGDPLPKSVLSPPVHTG